MENETRKTYRVFRNEEGRLVYWSTEVDPYMSKEGFELVAEGFETPMDATSYIRANTNEGGLSVDEEVRLETVVRETSWSKLTPEQMSKLWGWMIRQEEPVDGIRGSRVIGVDWHLVSSWLDALERYGMVQLVGHNRDGMCQYVAKPS